MPDDPYAPIADIYDFSYEDFDDDVEFYDNLARSVEGPVLELGVGSGRVALPLARRGHEVVGIDLRPWPAAPKEIEFHRLDLRKRAAEDVFRKKRPDAVVHMATVTSLAVPTPASTITG